MKHLDIQLDLSKSYNAQAFAAISGPHKGRVLYVAYGSNLSAVQARSRCVSARPVATAEITGAQLVFRGVNGFAHLRRSKKATAAAVVYSMSLADLSRMDRFEGVAANCYRRHQISLPMGRGYIYLMSPGNKPGRPSYNYWLRISDGMRWFGFKKHLELIQKMKPTKLRNLTGKPRPNKQKQPLQLPLADPLLIDDGERLWDVSSLPCYNFVNEASIQAYPSLILRQLIEKSVAGGYLFFFHGIFVDGGTRLQYGVSTRAVAAELHGFAHVPQGVSNVEYDADSVTPGVLAHVPQEALPRLDRIEQCPRWYRRETVCLDVCTLAGKQYPPIPIQFYIINTDLPAWAKNELRSMEIGTLSKRRFVEPADSTGTLDCDYQSTR